MTKIRLGLCHNAHNETCIKFLKVCDDANRTMASLRDEVKDDAELADFVSAMSVSLSKDVRRMTKKILGAAEYEDEPVGRTGR